jgi:hypothetical protein
LADGSIHCRALPFQWNPLADAGVQRNPVAGPLEPSDCADFRRFPGLFTAILSSHNFRHGISEYSFEMFFYLFMLQVGVKDSYSVEDTRRGTHPKVIESMTDDSFHQPASGGKKKIYCDPQNCWPIVYG